MKETVIQHHPREPAGSMQTLWVADRWIVPAAVAVAVIAAIIAAVWVLRAGKPHPDWCAVRDRIDSATTSDIRADDPTATATGPNLDCPVERPFCPRDPMRCCPHSWHLNDHLGRPAVNMLRGNGVRLR